MADMSMMPVQSGADRMINSSSVRPVNTDIKTETDYEQIKKTEAKENGKPSDDEKLKDLVSVSEHGDTLQVSKEGVTLYEEDEELGRIVMKDGDSVKPNSSQTINKNEYINEYENEKAYLNEEKYQEQKYQEQKYQEQKYQEQKYHEEQYNDENERIGYGVTDAGRERREEIIKEIAEKQNENQSVEASDTVNSSYASYTDSQLEQLYLKGEISKSDYDKEVEAREARREELEKEDKEFNNNMAKRMGIVEDAERGAEEIKKAFAPDASDTLSPADRIDMIKAAEFFNMN